MVLSCSAFTEPLGPPDLAAVVGGYIPGGSVEATYCSWPWDAGCCGTAPHSATTVDQSPVCECVCMREVDVWGALHGPPQHGTYVSGAHNLYAALCVHVVLLHVTTPLLHQCVCTIHTYVSLETQP